MTNAHKPEPAIIRDLTGPEPQLNRAALRLLTGDDGQPSGVVDVAKLQGDAGRFMFELAETAGDDAALDRVVEKWHGTRDPDEFGYLAAATLSLLVRCVLAPILDATDTAGIDLRSGLREAADNARRTL